MALNDNVKNGISLGTRLLQLLLSAVGVKAPKAGKPYEPLPVSIKDEPKK